MKIMKMNPDLNKGGYISDNNWTMCREYGKTPNGNLLNGNWVLRDANSNWIDFDKYRNDLAERHDFQLA